MRVICVGWLFGVFLGTNSAPKWVINSHLTIYQIRLRSRQSIQQHPELRGYSVKLGTTTPCIDTDGEPT